MSALVHDEKLADHHDDGHARRSWGIGLYIDGMAARYESAVDRVLANQVPCPQGESCQGDGRQRRIFDCEHRCGFRGCVPCLAVHEGSCGHSNGKIAQSGAPIAETPAGIDAYRQSQELANLDDAGIGFPGIKLLRKVGGRPEVRPHNCINNLSRDFECEVCGAVFEACNHSNTVCDKDARVYRCQDCGTVTGHFMTFAERETPADHAVIGNGLYARTRGAK